MPERPRIKLTDELSVEVIDPDNIPAVYADLVTEARVVDGVVYISLANLIIDGGDTKIGGFAKVCARLRISAGATAFIKRALDSPSHPTHDGSQSVN